MHLTNLESQIKFFAGGLARHYGQEIDSIEIKFKKQKPLKFCFISDEMPVKDEE